jgi:gluconate 2-dehydrogenase gamma chain
MSENRPRPSALGSRQNVAEQLIPADGAKPTAESSGVSRRRVLQVLGIAPIAAAVTGAQQAPPRQPARTPNQPAAASATPARSQPQRRFFTAKEWRTVRVLADDIIPRDERSGSATDAGVPEFIDFNLSVQETSDDVRTSWRGGLAWLDTESRRRFNRTFASATTAQRHAILDDISFPNGVPQGVPQGGLAPHLQPGAAFFARARDMIAAGFFSSAIGHKDLQYMGNTFNPNWNGCPPAALQKLGVSYDLMTSKR